MLVFTRRVKQRIVIGEREIEIVVRKIQRNGKVVLGIQAPKGIKIFGCPEDCDKCTGYADEPTDSENR